MALLDCLLLDTDVFDESRLLSSPASLDGTHHDRIDLIPTHGHSAMNRRHRHLANERDRDAFEGLRNSERPADQGTATVTTPCSAQSTRGTSACKNS